MRVQRQYTIAVPIPPYVPPSVIIAHLQTVSPIIRHLGTLSRYETTSAELPAIQSDPFFHQSPAPISGFQIYELITLAPGLTKEVTYPAYFQSSQSGVRCRANGAAGITGWADYSVRQRSEDSSTGSPGMGSTPSTIASEGEEYWHEYEIHETLLVEANSLLMPFVARTMEESHRNLLHKIIDEATQGYAVGHDTTSTTTTTPQDIKMQE
ncbi:hypothetical protein NLU13_9048 [Sarocladium strictum]|uniref:DUF7053 domain-containing protein n=1 Tax=Sarocladium strictum TaxID=5046 RepID=A0AA39L400_SARSR|nr:hypothetical protein NLU13_9048 [Sarocladium strictum]